MDDEDAQQIPIDGALDLHGFRPQDIGELIPDYLRLCRERGILEVRLIHGKGTGSLRRGVEAILQRLPEVVSYHTAGPAAGGWGATLVFHAPLDHDRE